MPANSLAFNTGAAQPLVGLKQSHLDKFMPMHILADTNGMIYHIGPTMARFQSRKSFVGRNVFQVLSFNRPKVVASPDGMMRLCDTPIKAHLLNGNVSGLRGSCVQLDDGGFLLNFGLGANVKRVVEKFGLKGSHFPASDPTAELLYMTEMQSFLLAESVRLNHRLNGAKRSAEDRAVRDPLTGLGNRRLLSSHLYRIQLRKSQGLYAFLHVDLDRFKTINDSFGHAAGDVVLQEVSRILETETRPDDVVVRFGGDEFVVILGNIDTIEQVRALADRLIERVSQPLVFGETSCQVGATVGGVVFDGSWQFDPADLLLMADRLLYGAKAQGRSTALIDMFALPESGASVKQWGDGTDTPARTGDL